jgi:uncharacterized protein YegJ (DUF2314 family)
MKLIIWAAVAALIAVAGWLCWWTLRRKRTPPLISLVALLRAPVEFDPVVLAKMANRIWDADLGDGTAEGEDGFVTGVGAINIIRHGDRMYLVNCMPRPYVEDPEAVSETIVDLRVRRFFRDHRAWFSFDALSVDDRAPAEEISAWYRRLARLFAEFLDENCLLIYVPDPGRAYAINDDTERALQSDDPLAALHETGFMPVIHVEGDDPRMQEAVAEAQGSWPRFLAAFEETDGEAFSIKAPITHAGTTEFIWITVTAVEGDQVYGTLANDPADLGPLELGSKVSIALSDLNDWCYIDPDGSLQGGFTLAAIQEASRRQHKS